MHYQPYKKAPSAVRGLVIVIALIDQVHTEQMFARGIFAQDLRLLAIHLDLLEINER